MKKGFDIHDFNRRMELALAGLRGNQNVSLPNRMKILEFTDYVETQEVGLPRRIKYLLNLGKFATMIQTDFEKATRKDIEAILLKYGRLSLADETKSTFKIMQSMRYQMKQIQQEQSRITTMLMDIIDLNSQGRHLKWIPPRQPQVDGLVVTNVEAALR